MCFSQLCFSQLRLSQRCLLTVAGLALLTAPLSSARAFMPPVKRERPGHELPKAFNAETFTLKNGLQVVVIPNHRIPVVEQMVWYKVGSADEAPSESGIAHFVEHLMFKGSTHMPPGEFSTRVKAMGGDDNAFTAQDYTAYHETVTLDHLPDIMKMEADRMNGLTFPPAHVDSERKVVLEERRQRTENDPRGYFGEQMRALLFVNHPYSHPVGGWFNEVDALTRDNVMAYYKKWYAPNNAILIVSGDITAAQLKPLAERTFGRVPPHAVPPRDWTHVPPQLGLPRLVMHNGDIEQPVWQRLIRVPGQRLDARDALALEVLADIMDGGAATRLYKALVVEQKVATNVGFSYDPTAYDDSLIWIDAVPAQGVSMETLEKAVEDQLRLLVKKGVSENELAEAKTRLKDSAVFDRDSIEGPAMIFGSTLASGGTVDDVEYWPSDIDGVTLKMAGDAAKKYLDPDNFDRRPYITGIMLPENPDAKPRGGGPMKPQPEVMQ